MVSNPKNDPGDRELLQTLFDSKWTSDSWAMDAQILRRASDLLFAAHQASTTADGEPIGETEDTLLNKPATLLFGYAMENAIKACLIKKFNLNAKTCREWNKWESWKHHDLGSLIGETGIEVSDEQLLLLSTLTAAVNWAGKYPVSFSIEGKKNPFLLPKQYDHASGVCENMPPDPLDLSMTQKLDPLFRLLMRGL